MKLSLSGLFLQQAEKYPGRTAIVHNADSVTCAALRERARALSAYLLDGLQLSDEQLVGIHGSRSINSVTAMLAVLQAGGAYVPLPSDWPLKRKQEVIEDAHLKVILETGANTLPRVVGCETVLMDAVSLNRSNSRREFPKLKDEQLAYVMYTSGSTGKPKGVMIEQRNVLAMLAGFEKIAPKPTLTAGSALVSIGFDVSVWEIFSVLCYGRTLHLVDHPEMVPELADYFHQHQINSAYLPPMVLGDFIQKAAKYGQNLGLGRLLVGVEPIQQKILQTLLDMVPGLTIINGYGPTETAICATFHKFKVAVEADRRTPIGKAVEGSQVHLVDEQHNPVPPGEEGELLICGAGVGRGYYGDFELTAEKFIRNPFGPKSGRCYLSGDFARELPDGSLEFAGRRDQQVKLGGFRIELPEIEAALARHPRVKQAYAAITGAGGKKKINAYYTSTDGREVSASILREFLQEELPQYMHPHNLIHVADFPTTVNGKIDRGLLPVSGKTGGADIMAARTDLEANLLRIFHEVFEDEAFGLEANFFGLGGNSLQAARILTRLKDQLGINLSFADFYRQESVGALAQTVSSAGQKGGGVETIQIPRAGQLEKPPLSYSQERMWFLAQSEPDNPSLHSSFALSLSGQIDESCLIRSLKEIVAHHAILRTVFHSEGGTAFQTILAEVELPLQRVDLSNEADPYQAARIRLTDSNLETFDIRSAPPFRMALYRLRPGEYILGVIIHHIIIDGWSAELFRRELGDIYRKIAGGAAMQPDENRLSYANYAAWQRSAQFDQRIQPQLAYWQKKLSGGNEISQLPNDHPRPLSQSSHASTIWLEVGGELYSRLEDYSRQRKITCYPLLLSAFSTTLSRFIQRDVIQIGTFFANRTLGELEGILGPFVNGVVLKLDLSGNPSFDDLADRTAMLVMEAQANQEAPIEKVIESAHVSRDRSQRTMFGIVFNYVNIPKSTDRFGDIRIDYFEFDAGTVTYDLNVEFNSSKKGLLFAFEYNTDIFNRETIQLFADRFLFILDQALQNPEKQLSQFEILTPKEKERINLWSGSQFPYPRDVPIHELFEKQAHKTPKNNAVVFGEQTLSYEALNRKANQIAHLLLHRGIGKGDLVGLSLPRNPNMLAALLGVLKAGCAYLPLDPTYPKEHLNTILSDAKPALVITDSEFRRSLPVADEKALCLDSIEKELAMQDDHNPGMVVRADDLAYCIYTSGSTGRPKGVLVEHRSLVNFTTGAQRYYAIKPADRMLQFATLNFDTSAEEIYPALCSGAALVLRTNDMLDSIPHFIQRCREWKVTLLDLPTAFWHELVMYLEKSGQKLPDEIRVVIIGGERVSPAHLNTWHNLGMEGIHLDNTYGLTECTCVSARGRLTAEERREYGDREAAIGKPIDNVKLYVLDENLQPVAAGSIGELYIGGDCLARGYLNLPELTAERFLADPFQKGEGNKMFKTGDLVRWRPDGSLEYLGRSDEQIKIRGFRIEPGEIEAALMQFAGIDDAVVIKRNDASGTDHLLAYLIMEAGNTLSEAELRKYLNTRLPKYMQPSHFQTLQEFPLSPNLKIDKNALPEPDWTRLGGTGAGKNPETPAEEKMQAIWAQMLGRQDIGVEDNFFDIGGHSLLAARMMTEIESQFNTSIPLVTLLEKPTIRELTKAITGLHWNPSWKSLVSLKAGGNQPPLFLIHAIGGDVLSYRRLTGYLSNLDRPIYGLRAQGLDGVALALEKVEDMAALYLGEIREIQPHGPYYLGGYSFGGTVAFEMAQQLAAVGEKTALLAMFDTVVMENLPANLQPGRLRLALDRLERTWFIAWKWLRLSAPKKAEYFRKLMRVAGDRLRAVLKHEKYISPPLQEDKERWQRKPEAFQKVEVMNQKALLAYVTKPYPGRVAYFKARQREWSEMVRLEPLWRKLALGGLSVHQCEGNHNTIMIEPYVKSLAAALKDELGKVENTKS